jgi:cell fate regulator YaaT (PSP1 superfamily)
MENENKNVPAQTQKNNHSGNHKRNRSQKHKSYFIDPNANQPAEQKNAPAQAQKPQQKPQQKPEAPKAQQPKPEPQKQSGENHEDTNQNPHQNRNNHNRHNRNKNHKKNNNQHNNQSVPEELKTADGQTPARNNETKQQSDQGATKPHNKNRRNKPNNDNKRRDEKANTSDAATESFTDVLNTTNSFIPSSKQNDKLQRPAPQKMTKFSESPEYAQYSDYEEFSVAELYGDAEEKKSAITVQNEDGTVSVIAAEEPTIEVVGIRFKSSGKTYYFAPNGATLKLGAHAIVETARGLEYGEVAIGNTFVKESETVPPLRPVIRKATDADIKHHAENKEKEDAAFRICNEKIIAHKLDMKLIDAQYTFDNTKLLFYFTSSGRVDFRDLVKDLASVFRTRIELRQIGIRDEAKMVGGLGLCGRPLCCTLFLSDFGQVSIKMAKEQNLSLNSSKISGICGRLMCCLRYEHDTYEYEIKRTPPVDSLVRTVDGVGVVTEINPLAATIKVKLTASPDTPPKSYKRDEVTVLKKKENS